MENKRDILKKQFQDFLENGADWEQIETSVPGIFVVKTPPTKRKPSRLLLRFNIILEGGRTKSYKGIAIADMESFEGYKELINDPRSKEVMKMLDEVNPINRSPNYKIEID